MRKSKNTDPQISWGTPKNCYLRGRRSFPFQMHEIPPAFRAFAEKHLLPRIVLGGYKVSTKAEIAIQALHSLVLTGQPGHCVSDTRDSHQRGIRLRVEVWVVGA